jgi:hypothetical protein
MQVHCLLLHNCVVHPGVCWAVTCIQKCGDLGNIVFNVECDLVAAGGTVRLQDVRQV